MDFSLKYFALYLWNKITPISLIDFFLAWTRVLQLIDGSDRVLREVGGRNLAVSSRGTPQKLVSDYAKSIGCADSPNRFSFLSRTPVP
jgi:hypothetical protein